MSEILQRFRFLGRFLPRPPARRLVLLTGARQTGKTTLARTAFPDLRYISLDAPENRDALGAIPTAAWARDIGDAILDEAQKEPVIFEKVKYAYDEGGLSFCMLLGSSQILLLRKIRESLAGRVSLFELWPLLMAELLKEADAQEVKAPLLERLFSKGNLDSILSSVPAVLLDNQDGPLRSAEEHLLMWGGMPALLPLDEDERWQWLRDYGYTYLERDLGDLARISDLSPFRKFQRLSALRSGRVLNYADLARDASVSPDTARRYLEYLRLSYQAFLLMPYHRNLTSSVIKAPKLYWADVGLLRQLSGFRGPASGEIYETLVVSEIVKWMRTVGREEEIFFYRTRSGLELDLLLYTEWGILGMEIKSRETIAPKDLTPLREVAGALGTEWRGGLIIYRGNKIRKVGEPHIWAIPSRRLLT